MTFEYEVFQDFTFQNGFGITIPQQAASSGHFFDSNIFILVRKIYFFGLANPAV